MLALSTSCVSKKVYTDLETKFADLKKQNREIADQNEKLLSDKNKLTMDQDALQRPLRAADAGDLADVGHDAGEHEDALS